MTYALSSSKPLLLKALSEHSYARNAYLELDVTGVPDIQRVGLYVWPEPAGRPTRVGVDVVRLDDRVLRRPYTIGFDLAREEQPQLPGSDIDVVITAEELAASLEEERPAVIRFGRTAWYLTVGAGRQREVTSLDRNGRPVFREVDTEVHCYKLVCSRCGRARYAMRNSLHQIRYCHVCTRLDRLRRRAVAQYRRGAVPHKRKRLTLEQRTEARRRRDAGETLRSIAEDLGVTPSSVCRMLKRQDDLE